MRHLLRRAAAVAAMLLLVSALLLAWSIAREYRRRSELYWYDVAQNYDYAFEAAVVRRMPVVLDADGLDWPDAAATCQTALLRVTLESGWSARWFEPAVQVSIQGHEPFAQHFERGAQGTRYLNLSPVCRSGAPGGAQLQLSAEHARLVPGPAELLLFRDPALHEGALLVLAPHPDDAEIAAFGLYRDRRDATVVSVTVGDYDNRAFARFARDDPAAAQRLFGRLRAWDSIAIPMWGGVPPERSLNLGYLGGSLPEMLLDPAAEVGIERGGSEAVRAYRSQNVSSLLRPEASASWRSLVDDLVHLLGEIGPAIVAAPHPLLDASEEHRLTTLALLEALERAGDDQVRLLLYDNHHVGSEYYPFGPADALVTLGPWFADAGAPPFGAVYSHPLDEHARTDKLFALDAMHDLRVPPRAELGDPTARMLRRVRRTLDALWRDPHRYYSYYRRAPRPNELFFVVEPHARAALREAASSPRER